MKLSKNELEVYRESAEEDCLNTPISVLRYISALEMTLGNTKTLEQRDGFINRHISGIPDKPCTIEICIGERTYLCDWVPFDRKQYTEINMPHEGYLGTAKAIEGMYTGVGFHAWNQNDSEFVYYKIIK